MKKIILFIVFSAASVTLAQAKYNPYAAELRPIDRKIKLEFRHLAAIQSAAKIYELPDLETVKDGATLIQKFNAFTSTLTFNYRLYFADPTTGLKYMILAPPNDASNMPWILAIAGTQTIADWIVDVDLGRGQFQRLSQISELFMNNDLRDGEGVPLTTREWIVTGHSLGGGLAQALSYKIQHDRLRAGLPPMRLETITMNGFGARELVEKNETFNTAIADLILATNYFVDGDLVSRIGTHIGATLKLPGSTESVKLTLKEKIRRHAIQNFKDIPIWLAVPETPPQFGMPKDLFNVGSNLSFFLEDVRLDPFFQPRMDHIFKVLTEAKDLLQGSDDHAARNYVKSLAQEERRALFSPNNGITMKIRVQTLDQIIQAL